MFIAGVEACVRVRLQEHRRTPTLLWPVGIPVAIIVAGLLGLVVYPLLFLSVALRYLGA